MPASRRPRAVRSRHGQLSPHHAPHHRPRAQPRVLRGARDGIAARAPDRPQRRARGDELLPRLLRAGRGARADVQPRRPHVRARDGVRPRRHRRRRPRADARAAAGAGDRARARAVPRPRGRVAPLLRPGPGRLPRRADRPVRRLIEGPMFNARTPGYPPGRDCSPAELARPPQPVAPLRRAARHGLPARGGRVRPRGAAARRGRRAAADRPERARRVRPPGRRTLRTDAARARLAGPVRTRRVATTADRGDALLPRRAADRRQPAARRRRLSAQTTAVSASLRYWWTNAIAMLPSPTAAATRLTGPKRTSPHAKMPGMLVSSRYGSRSSSQRPAARTSEPVRTYPRRSSATSGGSHAVSASAPMKMNRPPDA